MKTALRLACEPEIIELDLDRLLPTRLLHDGIAKTSKYACILASIRELGLIEPLVVFPQPNGKTRFLLLDGHVRLMILKSLGIPTAKCLISTDDEAFTYNHKVNRLSAIQEHFMVLRAIKNGVPEDRIARTLNVDVASIRNKRNLLDGICSEAVQLLRDKRTTANAIRELRKVKPMRQIEIVELMCASNTYAVDYVKCLVASSSSQSLINGEVGKSPRGLTPDDVARMEHELETLGREFRLIESTHGKNVLNLVVVTGYLKKLLDNALVAKFLVQHHSDIAAEFRKLVEIKTLTDGAAAKPAVDDT